MGLQILKFLRFEGCKEYGSDSFSGIEFNIVRKSGTVYRKEKGENGQKCKTRLFNYYSIIHYSKRKTCTNNFNSKMSVKILCKIKQTVMEVYPLHCSITIFFKTAYTAIGVTRLRRRDKKKTGGICF